MIASNRLKHAPEWEKPLLRMLVRLALKMGHSVSVHNGEEYEVKCSTSFGEVLEGMTSTGEDTILIHDDEGFDLGRFYLIYNNGSEGDPMIVICDYTCTDITETIYKLLSRKFDV
jgi:beta-xylosidase